MIKFLRAPLCAVLALSFIFALSSCGNKRDDGDGKNDDTEQDSTLPPSDGDEETNVSPDDGITVPPDDEGDADGQVVYVTEELYVYKGESAIYGKIYIPAENGDKMPAVILSHSAYLTADSMASYCKEFAERGYVAYAFDFCGGSDKSRSDGSTEDMTVFTETEDLKAVIAAIKNLSYVDGNEIYLFGSSQGGLVSALTAEDMSDEISGLILLYPAFNIADLVAKFSGGSILGSLSSFSSFGEAYITSLDGYDVFEHIGDFTGRVLIIHGSKDMIVDPSYSQRAANVYDNCTLRIIDGANHGFNSENYSFFKNYDSEVWEYIDEFLNI